MRPALEQSLFTPHKGKFNSFFGVFAAERMLSNFHVLDFYIEASEGRIQGTLRTIT